MLVKIGNIFDTECSTIVNTVNCVGVMGKGIALEFKKRYPDMYKEYAYLCQKGQVKIGEPYLYQDLLGTKILNFPTKDNWRSPSKLSYIIKGLDWFVKHYRDYDIESIAFPPLGCGNGGLSWELVGPIIYQKLSSLPIKIEIYAPFGTPQKEISIDFLSGKAAIGEAIGKNKLNVNPKWYLILQVVRDLNRRRYSLKVGRTIYQKICYVITRNGVDTGFKFVKGVYGPYSVAVQESITALANANLIIEEQLGKMLSLRVVDNVDIPREKFSQDEWQAVQKTVDLFGRVKSTEQAEMMSTVLYAYDQLVKKHAVVSDKEVYDYVIAWKSRWKSNKDYELCDTIHSLAMLSIINVKFTQQITDTGQI